MKKQQLSQIMVVGVLTAGLLFVAPKAWGDDTAQLKDQVKALQERVDQLESQLAYKQQGGVPAMSTPAPVVSVYDQWDDPLRQMMLMQSQMERNMHQAFANTDIFNPRMDMKQTDKQYIITMDIPGMDRDKINVEVKQGTLIISGERQSEKENNQNNQYYRQDRSFGSFMQAVPLPEDAKTDQIEAKYTNGVLTVNVGRQKKEEKKPENQKIKVN